MKDRRIMFVGDNFKYYTGFSYVLISLMKRFAASMDSKNICYVSMTNGMPEISDLNKFELGLSSKLSGIKLYDSNIEKEDTIINFNLAVTQFKPHIVISLNDPWRLSIIANSPFRDSFYWAAYTNIETPDYPRTMIVPSLISNQPRMNIHSILSQADIIIPYTKMGESLLLSWYDRDKVSNPVFNGVDLKDTEIETLKRSEVYDPIIPEDAFIFFSMGTNSPRKQMDKVVDAFAEFKRSMKSSDKYYLVMHTGSNTILNGPDLAEQIYKYKLQDCIYLTCSDSIMPADKEQLHKEYAACDCYIGFPGGEGFGYGFAEAIAHNKPVIYINYGGHVEYCKGCGIGVDVSETYRVRNSNIEWALPDIKSAAAAMRKISSDKNAYASYTEATKERRLQFSWNDIYIKFHQIINNSYNKKERTNLYGMARRRI